MQLEDYQECWENQPTDKIVSIGERIIEDDSRRRSKTTMAMLAFLLLNVGSAIHFFWASFFLRQEGIWIALMRCSLFALLAAVQFLLWRKLRRETLRREACVLDQRQCLGRLVDDLNREIRESNPVHALLLLALVPCFIGFTKWMDFRLGHDSAAECIAITLFATFAISMVPVGMWHYQQQFLIPRRDHIRGVLESLAAD